MTRGTNKESLKNLLKGNRFTSERQPSPQKKSEGRQKQIAQDNSIKEILNIFCSSETSEDVEKAFEKLGFTVETKLQALIAKYITLCLSNKATAKDINSLLEFVGKYTGQEPAQKLEIEDKPIINIDIPR